MTSRKYLALFVDKNTGISIGDDIVVLWDRKKGKERLLVSAPKHLNIGRVFGSARGDQIQGEGTEETKDRTKSLVRKSSAGSSSGNT